jgi:hypothetical protein
VIVVLTVGLLLAAVPPAPTRPPSLSSPALAAIAFGLAVSAGALGGALLVLTRRRHRDTEGPLGVPAERDDDPAPVAAAGEAPGAVGAQHRRPRGTPPRGMPEIGTRAGPLPLPPGTRAGWPGPWSGGRVRRSASGRYRVVPGPARGTGAMPDGGQVPVPRPRAGHDPSTTGQPSTGRSHTHTQAGTPSDGGPSGETGRPSGETGGVPPPRTPEERYVTLRTRRYSGPS